MAKRVITTVELTDDLDGGKADQTLTFAIQGILYEMDLSKKNAAAFEKVLAPYVAAARKVKAPGTPRRRSSTGGRPDLSAVREWARGNGHSVSERGRIAATIMDAYEAAH